MVTNKVTSDMMSAKALGKKAVNEIISSRLSNPRTTCILDPIKNLNLVTFASMKKVKTLHKKISFLLRISSVNVTKSAGNYEFGHIY